MPQPVRDALQAASQYNEALDAELHPCEGAKFHSPRPIVVHRIRTPHNRIIHLCGTCRDNVDIYLRLQTEADGHLPWETARSFGNITRQLGDSILLKGRS